MPLALAYTSYAVRMLQGRDIMQTTAAALPAESFVDLCVRAGASGCQIDLSQIGARDPSSLAALRDRLEAHGLFVELSAPAAVLETREGFEEMLGVARALGVSRVRTALLMGRRYESFETMGDWRAFVARWREALGRMRPIVEDSGLLVGIENHKDWLAAELRELLADLDSAALGACVDFGNNLALLEDPLSVVDTLAPYAVTTHLKDMAVRTTETGFDLAEVPLGQGLLPLDRMIATLRRAKPDVRFVLEMITRDPLPVPIRQERYWTTRDAADRPAAEGVAAGLVKRASRSPLPATEGLSPAEAIHLEDDHVRACVAYARALPGL
jgi:sugar phosphate isomerase/epimerase